jgi:hypothetical protein
MVVGHWNIGVLGPNEYTCIYAEPNTLATRNKILDCLGSNPTWSIDICPSLFSEFVLPCVFFLLAWRGGALNPFDTSTFIWTILPAPDDG